jgi:hypothetical protein
MAKRKELPPGVVSSLDQLAVALGYHRRTLCEWVHHEGFPVRPDGNYEILQVAQWRRGLQVNTDGESIMADLCDTEQRIHALIDSLREMQPELVQGLAENDQDPFAVRLRETIGKAIQNAFAGPLEYSYYNESYLRVHENELA